MKYIFLHLILLLSYFPSGAQQQTGIQRCGYDLFIDHQKRNNEMYIGRYEEVLRAWKKNAEERGGGGGVYVLPVVFHLVYNNENQNLPDEVILSQIDVLNEDYRRQNEDAVNTRSIFLPVAADCEISFELATTDPEGNATNGITRTQTTRTGFALDLFATENTLDEVKKSATGGIDAWDPEHYINIWVCNIEETFFGQIFGLSYPPANLDNWPAGSTAPTVGMEGVVLHYTTVGRNNPHAADDNFDGNEKGRTLTHELGHYLGLRHTWGDATPFFEDGCLVDDGISDTPNTATGDQFQCNFESNSCGSEVPGDLPDMIENYMDYTPDECLNMFTLEQRSLMRFVIENHRSGLLDGVGIDRIDQEVVLRAYPNPVAGTLQIEGLPSTPADYTIHDQTGRRMMAGTMDKPHNGCDVSGLSSGMYFLRCDAGIIRFIKE